MRIGLIGDLHHFPIPADEWIARTEPDLCLQAGDYFCYDHPWEVPVYWIFGNHEQGEVCRALIDDIYPLPQNSYWLMGGVVEINGVRIMALPGLPQARRTPGPASFPPKVYDLCLSLANDKPIDILLSHGAAFPFWQFLTMSDGSVQRLNFEEPQITDLVRAVRPRYAVSGHNHTFAIEEHEGIQCIRLGWVSARGQGKDLCHLIEI